MDKILHITYSFFIALVVTTFTFFATLENPIQVIHFVVTGFIPSAYVGCFVSAVIGLAKEIFHDYLLRRGTFDWIDIIANFVGIGAFYGLVLFIHAQVGV